MKKDLPVPTNKMGVVRTQGVQFVCRPKNCPLVTVDLKYYLKNETQIFKITLLNSFL